MNVPNDQIDRWRAFAEMVRQTTMNVRSRIARATFQGRADYEAAREQLQELHDAAIVTAQAMERAGAQRPGEMIPAPVVPLHLLDTPANRRYLRLLEETHAAALDVDEERGYGREGAGPAAGMIEMLLAETQEEVSGPVGALRE